MNKSVVYFGVGVATAAIIIIIIFAFLGNRSFSRVVLSQDEKTKENSIIAAAAAATSPAVNVAPIDIKIKNVVVNKTNDEKLLMYK